MLLRFQLLDDDFLKLLASIEEKFSVKHRIGLEKQAKKWHFCLQDCENSMVYDLSR